MTRKFSAAEAGALEIAAAFKPGVAVDFTGTFWSRAASKLLADKFLTGTATRAVLAAKGRRALARIMRDRAESVSKRNAKNRP